MRTRLVFGVCVLGPIVSAGCPTPLGPPSGPVLFVDANAAPGGNGASWDRAFNDLQAALDAASQSGQVSEIWVAGGTYRPAWPGGDRAASFRLLNDVAIYGGFAGSEVARDARDPAANVTVLSGDLDGDDQGPANNGENSYHVVLGSGTDATAVLDGFTISGGNANEDANASGGGMFNDSASPTINNCTFSGNFSVVGGGGMLNFNSSPVLTDCAFVGNSTLSAGGGMSNLTSTPELTGCSFTNNTAVSGGAISNRNGASPSINNCVFESNAAESDGGALSNVINSLPVITGCSFGRNNAGRSGGAVMNSTGSDAVVTNCTFFGNAALSSGGALFNFESSPRLVNCVFSGNTGTFGGGLLNRDGSSPALTNCTFHGNVATAGGGILNNLSSSPILANCILWANAAAGGMNEAAQIRTETGTPIMNFSCIQGGWTGAGGSGNIASDPAFVDADGPDNEAGTGDEDLRLAVGSPCIDAGDNTAVPTDALDLDGDQNTSEPTPVDRDNNPRFVDAAAADTGSGSAPVVDLGAFERISQTLSH